MSATFTNTIEPTNNNQPQQGVPMQVVQQVAQPAVQQDISLKLVVHRNLVARTRERCSE